MSEDFRVGDEVWFDSEGIIKNGIISDIDEGIYRVVYDQVWSTKATRNNLYPTKRDLLTAILQRIIAQQTEAVDRANKELAKIESEYQDFEEAKRTRFDRLRSSVDEMAQALVIQVSRQTYSGYAHYFVFALDAEKRYGTYAEALAAAKEWLLGVGRYIARIDKLENQNENS